MVHRTLNCSLSAFRTRPLRIEFKATAPKNFILHNQVKSACL